MAKYSLEPAFVCAKELIRQIIKASVELENEWFFFDGAFTSKITIEENEFNSWLHENFVVIYNGQIIAYFEASWDRPMDIISGFRFILFQKSSQLIIVKAMFDYLDYLFVNRGCQAFNWSVAKLNIHAYKIYEKFIKNYCGHVVGERHHAQKSYSGKISDIVLYEITKEEYFIWKNNRRKKS